MSNQVRSKDGRETWRRLLEWDKGQAPSERLAGHILRVEGFESIDPSHPLGGPDGLKDIVCVRNDKRWIGAAYFPRGQQTIKAIVGKLAEDFQGVAKNNVDGIAFLTNQELTLGERETLRDSGNGVPIDLFHLERIASILDSPQCYGLRLEFLDIEMTKEEQLAFAAQWHLALTQMKRTIETLAESLAGKSLRGTPNTNMPLVRPRNIGGDTGLYSVLGAEVPKPHECKSCHEIFLIDRSASSSLSALTIGGMTIITCPFCGHSERFNSWPY